VVLDVALIVTVIILPPPLDPPAGWPIQMRLRFFEYIYLLLYLAGSALSYSPLMVLWTGPQHHPALVRGVLLVYSRPDTLTFAEATGGRAVPASESLRIVLDPAFVGISQLWNQIALTAIITGLLFRRGAPGPPHPRAPDPRRGHARGHRPLCLAGHCRRHGGAARIQLRRPRDPRGRGAVCRHRGFTSIAEKLPPERVVALLRSFHGRACKIVFAHGGTLDKFLGDGFMATFGTLGGEEDCTERALACAFALQAEVERWRAKRIARGASPVAIAVGVHCGRVVVGNVGAERRLEFTVVGDPVNVAARLERLTREIGGRIAASREALEAAGGVERWADRFEAKGPIHLHGRVRPVDVFLWHGPAEPRPN
jgi:adenylate cyclase